MNVQTKCCKCSNRWSWVNVQIRATLTSRFHVCTTLQISKIDYRKIPSTSFRVDTLFKIRHPVLKSKLWNLISESHFTSSWNIIKVSWTKWNSTWHNQFLLQQCLRLSLDLFQSCYLYDFHCSRLKDLHVSLCYGAFWNKTLNVIGPVYNKLL